MIIVRSGCVSDTVATCELILYDKGYTTTDWCATPREDVVGDDDDGCGICPHTGKQNKRIKEKAQEEILSVLSIALEAFNNNNNNINNQEACTENISSRCASSHLASPTSTVPAATTPGMLALIHEL